MQSLEDGLGRIKAKPHTTQRATIAAHLGILKSLVAKETVFRLIRWQLGRIFAFRQEAVRQTLAFEKRDF